MVNHEYSGKDFEDFEKFVESVVVFWLNKNV